MDVFKYIAENPLSQQQAINLCYSYNMQPSNESDLADSLGSIVSNHGEDGLKAVMKIHPDKEVILNYHIVPPSEDSQRIANMLVYKNASGDTSTTTTNTDNTGNNIALQTNIIIFAAAVLIGFAIKTKN